MRNPPTASPSGESHEVDVVHRTSVVISLALAGGVLAFAGVAVALVETGAFTPFVGITGMARGGVGAFLVLLLGISYPLQASASSAESPASGSDPMAAYQTGLIVANAVRESAGIMGCVMILLAGDYVVGGTAAALAVATILLSLPGKEQIRQLQGRRR